MEALGRPHDILEDMQEPTTWLSTSFAFDGGPSAVWTCRSINVTENIAGQAGMCQSWSCSLQIIAVSCLRLYWVDRLALSDISVNKAHLRMKARSVTRNKQDYTQF